MRHRVIRKDSEFAALRNSWNTLLATTPQRLLPLSWEWFDAWWHSFRGGNECDSNLLLQVNVFDDDSRLLAVIPMVEMDTRLRGIRVHGMSSMANGHSPIWDAILHPNLGLEDLDSIRRTILTIPGIDIFLFRRIPVDSRFLDCRVLDAFGFVRYGIRDIIRTPVVGTKGDFETWWHSRSRKYRSNLRKKIRTYVAQPGAKVEFVPLSSGNDPVMEEVIEVSRRSWKVEVSNDLGSNAASKQFLQRLIRHIGPRGDAGVWIGRVYGQAIAFELHVSGFGITYPIRADIDEVWRALSPGSVLEYHAVKAAFERPGITVYDTCAANYWYLSQLTEEARLIHYLEVFPRRPKCTLLHALEYRVVPLLRKLRNLISSANWGKRIES